MALRSRQHTASVQELCLGFMAISLIHDVDFKTLFHKLYHDHETVKAAIRFY